MTNSDNKLNNNGLHKKNTVTRAQQLNSGRKKSSAEKKKTGLIERKYWIKPENANALAETKKELKGLIINGTEITEIGSVLDVLIETYLLEMTKKSE